jgi:SAM-dependent methyltransferase
MAGTSPANSALTPALRSRPPRAGEFGAIPPGPRRFDPDVAHPARVYGYWLGGKDHFAADRMAAEEVIRRRSQVADSARANRAFLSRAVLYLAGRRGVRQFVDIGCGLPAPGGTHEVAQAVARQSRVVYVDNDPLVLSHARALVSSTPEGACGYVDADLRDPETILLEAARSLDFSRPVAVLVLAVAHFLPDSDDPGGIVAALAAGLAPGSFIAISHLTADFAPDAVSPGVAAYNTLVPAGITARSHAQVTALLGGLSLVPPGVVPVVEWRRDIGDRAGQLADLYAGLAVTGGRWLR